MMDNFRLSAELSLREQEEHSLYQYLEEAKERYEKTKSFRHDIKNHMTVLKELLHMDIRDSAFILSVLLIIPQQPEHMSRQSG